MAGKSAGICHFVKRPNVCIIHYYNYQNLWHGLCATAPFVRWAMKNQCLKPTSWVLFHWGDLRFKMGSWVSNLMEANFGEIKVEGFDKGDGPYCFEKAVVMRHVLGSMGMENKFRAFDLLRCKARRFCGINSGVKGIEVKVMTYTDIVASPHGAQLTNMLFMDRNGSIMEFFPKGWLEHAGIGQYAHHWMANQSGMRHRGAWWRQLPISK
ncbi:hypothetical protein Adt_20282 [Abeliophyllum distichum]|uniref:Uncharacterized protein n=1 Tax=Abeliophyllum distichum TaxID=126358 RepID=A0ABD1SW38_9LAMI